MLSPLFCLQRNLLLSFLVSLSSLFEVWFVIKLWKSLGNNCMTQNSTYTASVACWELDLLSKGKIVTECSRSMNVSQGKTKKKNLPFTFNENRTWQIQIDSICTIWNLLTKGALVTGRGRQFLGWGFWGLVIIIILFLLPLAIFS